jgi:hypothetical protein
VIVSPGFEGKEGMTLDEWKDLLRSCNDAPEKANRIVLFDDAFVNQWKNEPVVLNVDDRSAAAKLHIQLVSRITTQRLPYVDGEEAAALKSVYELFGEAREIFEDHPESSATDAIVWHVMNTHVRPFTAKWHRQNERGALAALDATDIFRHELATLQRYLVRFDALLVAIRDAAAKAQFAEAGNTAREDAIESEMDEELSWGIHKTLGGLEADIADKINAAERTAVLSRRAHYRKRLHPNAAEETPDAALKRQPFATGLAISGGGIRSATFALGVLAALARRNLLYQFDYLSTVSGGGYVGAFLTTYLSAATPTNGEDELGLTREDLPFRRKEGEAAALRHVRHHSKYLATGRLWERLQMASAQAYGMAMNGLGFAYLAFAMALIEVVARKLVSPVVFEVLLIASCIALAATPFLIPGIRRIFSASDSPDRIVAGLFLAIVGLIIWNVLDYAHSYFDFRRQHVLVSMAAIAAVSLLAAATLNLITNVVFPIRLILLAVVVAGVPLLFLEIELAVYRLLNHDHAALIAGIVILLLGLLLFWRLFDINFTAPHRFYKKKLGQAYLVQPDPNATSEPLHENVSLKVSECNASERAPYHLVNCALNVPASTNPKMQGRLTDFFLFSRRFCGSPLTGYHTTDDWEEFNPDLDLGTAMAISGAAAAPQMGLGTIKNLSFWLALFNVRLGYWIRNPAKPHRTFKTPPGLPYLLSEMFGLANETHPYINISDGGHIENLGVYELLRRRCKYIVAIDGEQDETMTFQGLTTLLRLAYIDLGITIDVGLDALRLAATGLSHSHFALCRIRYPRDERDGDECYGYLLYLKLSLTGNEGEFIRRYRLDEPAFPHTSTANQFFSEAQFEAYRSLGEHVGDKMFLPAIVGEEMARGDASVALETWFGEIGKNMLEPLPGKESPPPAAEHG